MVQPYILNWLMVEMMVEMMGLWFNITQQVYI